MAFVPGIRSEEQLQGILEALLAGIPVSGTVAVTQSGTWVLGANSGVDIGDVTVNNASGASAVNIQDGGNSITIDGSLTNISGTISLPTGASTSANQTTEITSLQLIDDLVLAQNANTSGQSGVLIQGAVTTAAPTYSTGKINPLSISTTGNLRVDGSSVTQPVSNSGLASLDAAINTDGGGVNTHSVMVGGQAFTDIPSVVIGNTKSGWAALTEYRGVHVNLRDTSGNQMLNTPNTAITRVFALGAQLDDTSTASVTENNIGALRITSSRGLHINPRNSSGTELFNTGANSGFAKIYDGSGIGNVPVIVLNAGGFGAMGTVVANPSTLATLLITGTGEAPVMAASTNNTLANARYIKVDSNGIVQVSANGGSKASYSASISALATAATATDIFTIKGSGTKTVSITQIVITGLATTAISVPVSILIRSSADTGGTSTTPTIVPHDSSDAAATAVVNAYTANPTTGTLVGAIRSERVAFPLTGALPSRAVYDFGVRPSKPIVLRGTSQQLCINFNSTTVLGSAIDIWVEFTEE